MNLHLRKSRLARSEATKNIRRAYLLLSLILLLILASFFFGIPLLIKLATLLGELKSSSTKIETRDNIPPPPPQFYNFPETINQPAAEIQGLSEANSKVTIYINGQSVKELTADKNGSFSTQITLAGERNEITLQAKDESGNKSQDSEKIVIILDNQPPQLTILFPPEKSLSTDKNQLQIQGSTEENTTVNINDHLVILNQKNEFRYPVLLAEGENSFTISARDEAGNLTTEEIKITYQPF